MVGIIQANNPEINIDMLMVRVAADAARLRDGDAVQARRNAPRPVAAGEGLTRVYETHTAVCLTVDAADKLNCPRSALPKRVTMWPRFTSAPLRFVLRAYNYVFKEQREITMRQNAAISGLAAMALETAEYIRRKEQRELSDAMREALRALNEEQRALSETSRALAETNTALIARLAGARGTDAAHDRLDGADRALTAISERLDLVATRVTDVQQMLNPLVPKVQALGARSERTPDGTETQLRIVDALREVERRIANVQDRGLRSEALLRSELIALRQSGATPSAGGSAITVTSSAAHLPDATYEAIEDRFRGSSADVRALLEEHLPRVTSAATITPATPLLDVGCGRGEWLELLQVHDVPAFGIDTNLIAVHEAIARGVDARHADVLTTLASAEAGSIGAITAFHVVEHLPFAVLLAFLESALRALVPGGLLILETPNPANVLVATQTFWLDPTHLRPIPQQLLALATESSGFTNIEVLELHAPSANAFDTGSPLAPLNAYFSAPQDYAVAAVRPV